ncbi:hypothetical protein [Orbus mooreae]|uniref:hypothetical protein n=1 Tax=Orbus mooreae TaxID=3074107 RepID=UPI00370DC453
MSSFHDQLLKDNQAVFFNPDEFAQTIKWNGYDIIVTDETPSEVTQFTHGIEQCTVIYRIPKIALTKPRSNERVDINGELWLVKSVQEQLSDYVVRLERYDD